jgi:hypothetical protein
MENNIKSTQKMEEESSSETLVLRRIKLGGNASDLY